MILGVIIGIIMAEFRGVLFASLAGALTNLGMFFAMYRPHWVASGTVTDDAAGYAIVAVMGWLMCLIVASIVYGVKRIFIRRDRATADASA